MMGTSERRLLCARLRSACVVVRVDNGYRWWFCGVVLSDVRTPSRTLHHKSERLAGNLHIDFRTNRLSI